MQHIYFIVNLTVKFNFNFSLSCHFLRLFLLISYRSIKILLNIHSFLQAIWLILCPNSLSLSAWRLLSFCAVKTGWVRRALKDGKGEAGADRAATWLVGLLTYWLINLRPAVKRRLKWVKWQWQWQWQGEGKGKSQLVWGRTARSQIGNGNDNRQARRRPRPYRANDRARLATPRQCQ